MTFWKKSCNPGKLGHILSLGLCPGRPVIGGDILLWDTCMDARPLGPVVTGAVDDESSA